MLNFFRKLVRRAETESTAIKPSDLIKLDRTQQPTTMQVVVASSPFHTTNSDEVPEELSPAAAYERLPFERRLQLRRLDSDIAANYLFFTSVEFDPPRIVIAKGIPTDYDGSEFSRYGRRDLVTIPYYSSDPKHFLVVEERVRSWHGDLYLLILAEQGLDVSSATLEQKCRAALDARVRSATARRSGA